MTILSDEEIEILCRDHQMITPFTGTQIKTHSNGKRAISYGVSSYGYDIRAGFTFKIFSNINNTVADPKNFDERSFVEVKVDKPGDHILIPPNSFALTHSLEHFKMPRDVTGVVLGKSTLARVGIVCICTPLEAGWEGYVTLEFANTTPLPAVLYAGEGCCQVLFLKGKPCKTSYLDRGGKYMYQGEEVVLPRV